MHEVLVFRGKLCDATHALALDGPVVTGCDAAGDDPNQP